MKNKLREIGNLEALTEAELLENLDAVYSGDEYRIAFRNIQKSHKYLLTSLNKLMKEISTEALK